MSKLEGLGRFPRLRWPCAVGARSTFERPVPSPGANQAPDGEREKPIETCDPTNNFGMHPGLTV